MKNSRLFLKQLRLQNFATFENMEVEFAEGFNAITGETGSGKSLILDALQLALGQRADKKFIRKGAEFAIVEALFSTKDSSVKAYLKEAGYPIDDDEILIKRVVYQAETSKSFFNFQTCSVQFLLGLARQFVDLVGQFENQKLLSSDYQLELLDSYAGAVEKLEKYKKVFSDLSEKKKEKERLDIMKLQQQAREEFLNFQITEMKKFNPSEDEEQELIKKKESIINGQKYQEVKTALLANLSENQEANALDLLKASLLVCEKTKGVDLSDIREKLKSAHALIEEVSFDLAKGTDEGDAEEELNYIIERLDGYQRFKKKLGGDSCSVVMRLRQLEEEWNSLKNLDSRLVEFSREIAALDSRAHILADELFNLRVKKAAELSVKITESVHEMKMEGASIRFMMSAGEDLHPLGKGTLEFLAETNKGEGLHRIKDIASGGELSRILLALRKILSTQDSVSVFLFDEIDTGIGGETSKAVGATLKEVSHHSQVIVVTHLPQIAFFADKVINVSKAEHATGIDARTVSKVSELTGKDKERFVKELARL